MRKDEQRCKKRRGGRGNDNVFCFMAFRVFNWTYVFGGLDRHRQHKEKSRRKEDRGNDRGQEQNNKRVKRRNKAIKRISAQINAEMIKRAETRQNKATAI